MKFSRITAGRIRNFGKDLNVIQPEFVAAALFNAASDYRDAAEEFDDYPAIKEAWARVAEIVEAAAIQCDEISRANPSRIRE